MRITAELSRSGSRFAGGRVALVTCTLAGLAGSACTREEAPKLTIVPSVASMLIARSPQFRGELTMRVPRSVVVEPRFGANMARGFAQTMGRELYSDSELQIVAPLLSRLKRDSLVRVDDSPISETYASDGDDNLSHRANTQRILIPQHQRSQRYWRHYLAITPVNSLSDDWMPDEGRDEIDESLASTRIVRTPGWRAVLARRQIAGIASISASSDTVIVRYRWRWQPTPLGAPFVNDSVVAGVAADAVAPKIPRVVAEGEARFVRAEDGWTRVDSTRTVAAQPPQ